MPVGSHAEPSAWGPTGYYAPAVEQRFCIKTSQQSGFCDRGPAQSFVIIPGAAQRIAVRQREHTAVRGAVDTLAGHLVHGTHLVRAVLAESMESTLRGLGHDVGTVGEDKTPADGDLGNINLGAWRLIHRARQAVPDLGKHKRSSWL